MSQPGRINSLRFSIAMILASGVLSSSIASAASPTRQAQERTARKACLSGDCEKGVDILSDLFVETIRENGGLPIAPSAIGPYGQGERDREPGDR